MSAADDDTELRDLLIQNLENNGVLNKLKAEMRAAVFLALEEQDKLENKTPLVNEALKKCLNTRDGRLVVGLIVDFLQVFHLDFSLAVFQPEINSLNSVDGRETVSRELGLSESDVNKNSPLLLELVRRRHKDNVPAPSPEVLQQDIIRPQSPPAEEKISSQPISKQRVFTHRESSVNMKGDGMDLDLEGDNDPDEDDSFFDDPLPKPQKTYGWKVEASRDPDSPVGSLSSGGGRSTSEHSVPKSREPAFKDAKEQGFKDVKEQSFKDSRVSSDKSGSLHLDEDVEYDDDFNSHRSDLSRSELSIGEEIEEVSIEGPESSDKLDDTQDLSVSQLSQNHSVDYMEDVA